MNRKEMKRVLPMRRFPPPKRSASIRAQPTKNQMHRKMSEPYVPPRRLNRNPTRPRRISRIVSLHRPDKVSPPPLSSRPPELQHLDTCLTKVLHLVLKRLPIVRQPRKPVTPLLVPPCNTRVPVPLTPVRGSICNPAAKLNYE